MEEDILANKVSSGLKFDDMLGRMLLQNGYSSDNTKKGLRTAEKDYEALFKTEPPKWLTLIWPSTAVSLVHLALSSKHTLPEKIDIPPAALKS